MFVPKYWNRKKIDGVYCFRIRKLKAEVGGWWDEGMVGCRDGYGVWCWYFNLF